MPLSRGRKKLSIVHVSAEVDPFFKSGGLALVASALPKAEQELGHHIIAITPFYRAVMARDHNPEFVGSVKIPVDGTEEEVGFYRGWLSENVPIYFISHKKYFDKRKTIYGATHENVRFLIFDIAALHLLKMLNIQPDIIHCHDWHAGLIPYLLNTTYKDDSFWKKTATVFTIHNLVFQFGHDWWKVSPRLRDDGQGSLPSHHESRKIERINFAKRGIMNANVINTVSETYRNEILTKNFGEELHRILKNREDHVYGIVNGIDYDAFNPSTDPGLQERYDYNSIERRAANKAWLQRHLKLEVDPDIPIIVMTSRIAEQKGFYLLMKIVETVLRLNTQIIIMGDGDQEIIKFFNKIHRRYPKRFAITPFSSQHETSLYAGGDIFLLPSRFEPSGLNQLIALRYGCIPVVHHIGGLADTVTNFNPRTRQGNGFTFKSYRSTHLLVALVRAIETYKYPDVWKEIIRHGMQEANSWKIPAEKYISLYRTALKLRSNR